MIMRYSQQDDELPIPLEATMHIHSHISQVDQIPSIEMDRNTTGAKIMRDLTKLSIYAYNVICEDLQVIAMTDWI